MSFHRPDMMANALADSAERGEEIFVASDSNAMRRLLAMLGQHRRTLIFAISAVIIHMSVQILIPITVRYAVDSAVGKSAYSLDWVLVAFASVVVLSIAFNFLQEWLAARLAQRVIFDLRRDMFAHLQDVALATYDRTQVGRLMARVQGDVNALQEFMENSVTAIGDVFLLVGIIVVLLLMDVRLGLYTLAVLPVIAVSRLVWMPWASKLFRRAREASSSVNAALAENINGIRTVQESRREALNLQRYTVKAEENFQAQIGSSRASQVMVPTVDLLTGVAMAVVVVIGGHAVLGGSMGVGVMVAYIFYVQRFFDPIRTLSMQYTIMQRAMASARRIFEVLDLPIEIQDKPDAKELDGIAPSIELRNVTFGYKAGQPILHDINLKIDAYQTVALVGVTGSGKTSITALIHRFYDVWDGAVIVGGHDVRDVSQDALGHTIGMVLQEPFLFTGTILENIRYGLHDASEADVIEAAKAVRAHDFIQRLPAGYQTMLGQRGRNLSIGQRQLLSFARALLAKPKILILDEATANIDSFTELEIQQALQVLRKGRTTIIIAHRLATIRDADLIVVVQAGHIIEQGTHDALLRRGGVYAGLHASSVGSFDEAERRLERV